MDSYRMILEDNTGKVEPEKLKFLCNKPTAFYFLQSAQGRDASGERNLVPGSRLSTKSGIEAIIPSQISSTGISLQTL
jgi:hypothetical protein